MKKFGYLPVFIAVLLILLTAFSGCGAENGAGETAGSAENDPPAVTDTDGTEETDGRTTGTGPETSDPRSIFDGAVFVGDSVTMGLRNYVVSERNDGQSCLGDAVFLTAGSMGYTNTIQEIGAPDAIHPRYNGEEMYIEDALALMNAEKVFIMLGMNDFCIYSVETGMGNAETLINRINEKNPGTEIYVESVTPVIRDRGDFNNANIDAFNAALKELCAKNGWMYIDIASVMKDPDGRFIGAYCSDPDDKGIHMTYEGCEVWVNCLYDYFR